eukprot:CAMPEP_0183739732 /NCGR_PEP_ID=MMETSP0737-20130205/57816_1 /TAXON_ID=385413 /ORGANISM="Thalassiosira miniscula, Strain CCMP1093" /LENGTH=264 /DNA_ID=CAMNT_0025974599 /DNA_START=73 /DNA_END=867 /DNA_ORIENTATION=-
MAQRSNILPSPPYGMEIPSIVSPSGSDSSLDGLQEEKAKLENISLLPRSKSVNRPDLLQNVTHVRLNKFVRRLHDMLTAERDGGIVEWRRGLLILHSISTFSKEVLPKYFNTRNFKTFRRQLNYYGFLHVRSFSASSSATTALWVNQELANNGSDSISSVLRLKRVEPPGEASKTPEGRRERKNSACSSVEVQGLGGLVVNSHNNIAGVKPSCPVPKIVLCQQAISSETSSYENALPSVTLPKKTDETIDQAAGLLLALSHAAA